MSIGSCVCKLRSDNWVIEGDPYLLHRVERALPNTKRVDRTIVVRATDEAARDLMWFRTRFPMQVEPEVVLRVAAARYTKNLVRAKEVLSEGYVPSPVAFAPGESPRDYQSVAADLFRATKQLLIADGLGCGKTISALAAIADENLRPAVVVLPPHLEYQWKQQLKRFLPRLMVHGVASTTPYSLQVFKRCQCGEMVDSVVHTKRNRLYCTKCSLPVHAGGRYPDVVLVTYNKLKSWVPTLTRFCKTVIFEECHALRRSESEKWRAARDLSHAMQYRAGLSATPIYNYGGEAWNLFECLAPGFLGTKDLFRSTWCEMIGYGGREPALANPDAFGAYLRANNLMIRRTAAEVGIKLGDSQRITHQIEADPSVFDRIQGKASELARIILDDTKRARGETMQAASMFDVLLRQATGLAKAPYVAAFVELILQQDIPVVLFGWHRAVYDVWLEKLREWKPALYTGSESQEQKTAAVHRFRTGDTNLFICSLRSGEGLDGLQFRCSTNVFGELDWSPSVHSQCIGRTDRDGQTQPVNSYFLVSEFGLDPYMAQVLGIKRDQAESILGDKQLGPIRRVDSETAIRSIAAGFLSRR